MTRRKVVTGWTRVRWSHAMREGFLDRLAETCSVKEAAAAIGVRAESVYLLRRREPAFREAWQAALELGYQAIETRLLGRAMDQAGDESLDVELSIRLLTRHGDALNGKVPRTGSPPRPATREETDAAILRKIEMIERARQPGVA